MRKLLYILLLAFVSCSMSDDDNPSDELKVHAGDRIPTFTITLNDNTQFTSSNLDGKPCVIVFFSTTCEDCRRELPLIEERYRVSCADTTFIAIAREQSLADIAAYWEENDFHIPFSPQEDRKIYSLFATIGIPRYFTISSNGIVEQCR